MRRFFEKRSSSILSNYSERELIMKSIGANFFGVQSKGMRQVRGNGLLILTEREVVFHLYLPKQEFRIPLRSIIRLETPKSHLGKSRFRRLLKIVFTNDTGQEDSIAWLVNGLENWISKINSQLGKR